MNETKSENPTLDVLREMALEDTGRGFMDSGDAYGRNWEQNRKGGVVEQPEAELTAFIWTDSAGQRNCDLGLTLNVVPWLEQRLEFDAELDLDFRHFANQPEWEHAGWLEVVEEWERARGFDKSHEGDWGWINTYNGEDALSQIIQFKPFTDPEDESYYDYFSHVALQIHGGCDARGGYTAPRIFKSCSEIGTILDNARGAINCGHGVIPDNVSDDQITLDGSDPTHVCGAFWTTDNAGYTFDPSDGAYPRNEAALPLGEYPIEVRDYDAMATGEVGKIIVIQSATDQYKAFKVFCPVCGNGELWAYPY